MILPGFAKLRYSSSVNVVFDGNSLVAGAGTASAPQFYLPAQVAATAPMVGTGATMTNLGISGQTWRNMDGLDSGSSADVDSAWVNGKKNVLICWETTNSVYNTARTANQTVGDAVSYINDRLIVHPWIIVLMTTLPRQVSGDQTATNANNLVLVDCDNAFRQNYRSWGAKALCDVRAGSSPFNFTSYTLSDFAGPSDPYWHEANGGRIHMNDLGYGLIASYVDATIKRLPPH